MKYNTVNDVINKLNLVHGDKYDYSKVTLDKKITIICPVHGEWTASRSDIFRGSGCKKCYYENKKSISTEQFIERAMRIHGVKYEYSNVNFVNWKTNVDIICNTHKCITSVRPANFLSGLVPKCCKTYRSGDTKNQFISKAKLAHGDKYDYTLVEYTNQNTKVNIICRAHGTFTQTPTNHKAGHGCPKCANVFSNSKVEMLLSTEFDIFDRHDRTLISPKELDLVSHDHKLAIEVNGCYWHSTKFLDKNYHLDKTNAVEEKGYQLLHFWDYEINDRPELVKSMIASKLGLNRTIYARKCSIISLTATQSKMFSQKNHIQGAASGESVIYGLLYDNNVVSIMSFGISRFDKNYDWELIRFCNIMGTNVIGGASKLFKHFLVHHRGSIMSYANRRISNGNLYKQLGFKEVSRTKPNYFWLSLSSGEKLTRQKCQKHKLPKLLGAKFNPAETEKQNMERNGYVQCLIVGISNMNTRYKIKTDKGYVVS